MLTYLKRMDIIKTIFRIVPSEDIDLAPIMDHRMSTSMTRWSFLSLNIFPIIIVYNWFKLLTK